jgi:hypothetical protein
VKGLRSSSIPRSAIGSVRDQEFRNPALECRGRHVKRGVGRIEVVSDVGEEEGGRLLTCSAQLGRLRRESRTVGYTPGHLVDIATHDHMDEIKEG